VTINARKTKEIGLWVAYVLLSANVNATSVLMEHARDGRSIAAWEPFVWEYSSGLFILALIPFVLAVEKRFPFSLNHWKRPLFIHLAASVPFSLIHVGAMVLVRKVAYAMMGRSYDFGDTPIELLYEWRKDLLTYGFIIFVVNAYRVFRERHEGDANFVDRPAAPDQALPGFRVTKNGRDIYVTAGDIDWIEAAGNYVVLHSGDKTFMMRQTMTALEQRLSNQSFIRAHRSVMVNLDRVEAMRTDGGRHRLTLKSGETIAVSKRLAPAVKARLGARDA
jgi:LytTr DNA-binding domain